MAFLLVAGGIGVINAFRPRQAPSPPAPPPFPPALLAAHAAPAPGIQGTQVALLPPAPALAPARLARCVQNVIRIVVRGLTVLVLRCTGASVTVVAVLLTSPIRLLRWMARGATYDVNVRNVDRLNDARVVAGHFCASGTTGTTAMAHGIPQLSEFHVYEETGWSWHPHYPDLGMVCICDLDRAGGRQPRRLTRSVGYENPYRLNMSLSNNRPLNMGHTYLNRPEVELLRDWYEARLILSTPFWRLVPPQPQGSAPPRLGDAGARAGAAGSGGGGVTVVPATGRGGLAGGGGGAATHGHSQGAIRLGLGQAHSQLQASASSSARATPHAQPASTASTAAAAVCPACGMSSRNAGAQQAQARVDSAAAALLEFLNGISGLGAQAPNGANGQPPTAPRGQSPAAAATAPSAAPGFCPWCRHPLAPPAQAQSQAPSVPSVPQGTVPVAGDRESEEARYEREMRRLEEILRPEAIFVG